MNTQTLTYKRTHAVRQATINKLCVALTELTEKVDADKVHKNFRETFNVFCKNYKVNPNLWYSLKKLGYVCKQKDGWIFNIKRQQINKTMAKAIIEDYNVKVKTNKDFPSQRAAVRQQNSLVKKDEKTIAEENEMYIILTEYDIKNFAMHTSKRVFTSLKEVEKSETIGNFTVMKCVGKLTVVPQTKLKLN